MFSFTSLVQTFVNISPLSVALFSEWLFHSSFLSLSHSLSLSLSLLPPSFPLTRCWRFRIVWVVCFSAHQSRVSAVQFSLTQEWVLSAGRDKYFQWHCSETGRRLGGYQAAAWCTSLQYPHVAVYC